MWLILGRRTGIFSVLLMAGISVGCQSTGPKPAEQKAEERWNTVRAGMKLQLAAQHAERGRFEESLVGASEAMALDPQNAEACVLVVKAHLEHGRLASAEQAIAAAGVRKVSSPDLIYLSGVVLEQRGQLDAALAKYASARIAGSATLDYLIAEAECLVALDRAEEALVLLENHAHVFDDDAALATLAGRTALLLGQHEEAVRWFREALAKNPESPSVTRELGLLLARMSRCKEAIPVLRSRTEKDDDASVPGSVYRALATCYLGMDDAAAASAALNPYLSAHPNDASGQLLAAQAALASQDLLGAAHHLHLAEKFNAGIAQTGFVRAVLATRQGNLRLAAEQLDNVLAANPGDTDASCLLGDVLSALGDRAAAADAYSRALHTTPDSRWAATGLARLQHSEP